MFRRREKFRQWSSSAFQPALRVRYAAYALTVAAVCVVGYLLSGFVHNVFIVLGFSVALMLAVLFAIRFFVKRKEGRG